MERKLVIYETKEGKRPFTEWLADLRDRKGRAVIQTRLNRVRLGNLGDCKSIGDGVFELRVKFGPGYRVYFGQEGVKMVILLCGGDKGSQQRDIDQAKSYWRDYKDAN